MGSIFQKKWRAEGKSEAKFSDMDHASTLGAEKSCNSVTTLVHKLTLTRHLAFGNKTDFRSGDF